MGMAPRGADLLCHTAPIFGSLSSTNHDTPRLSAQRIYSFVEERHLAVARFPEDFHKSVCEGKNVSVSCCRVQAWTCISWQYSSPRSWRKEGRTRMERHAFFFQKTGTPVGTTGYVVSTVWSKSQGTLFEEQIAWVRERVLSTVLRRREKMRFPGKTGSTAEPCPGSSRSSGAAFLEGDGVGRGLRPSVLHQALRTVRQQSRASGMVPVQCILGERRVTWPF